MDHGQFYSALSMAWVFGFAIVLLVAWHLRNKRRLEKLSIIHEERMKAMEKGIPLPELPEIGEGHRGAMGASIEVRSWNPRWPLGVGALLIMAGLGTSMAMLISEWELHNDLWAFGLVGVFLGIGMFLFYGLTRTPRGEG